MPESELARALAAAAALVLQPPTPEVLVALSECEGESLALDIARQNFYDTLCVPQSGHYIPPYAHVLTAGRARMEGDDELWSFPPPRYDGGDALAPWYEAVSFDPMSLDVDPMLRGPHRPLDHIGFILSYTAGLVATCDTQVGEEADAAVIATFVDQHLNVWPERFCCLLSGETSTYLRSVAQAVLEAVDLLRTTYPVVLKLKDPPVVESSTCLTGRK